MADVGPENADALVRGQTIVLDGTDNFETRFLLNDVCVRAGVPWVYGACVGSYGLALLVRPGVSPCLRCVLETMPAPGSGATCDTAGVVAPIVQVVAGIQAGEALKVLAGRTESVLKGLVSVDLWTGHVRRAGPRRAGAVVPGLHGGTFRVRGKGRGRPTCCVAETRFRYGPPPRRRSTWTALAARLRAVGEVTARTNTSCAFAHEGRRARSSSATAGRSSRA